MRHRSTKCSKQARICNQQELSAVVRLRCSVPDRMAFRHPISDDVVGINNNASPGHDHRLDGMESGDLLKMMRIAPATEDRSNRLVLPPVVAKAVRWTTR